MCIIPQPVRYNDSMNNNQQPRKVHYDEADETFPPSATPTPSVAQPSPPLPPPRPHKRHWGRIAGAIVLLILLGLGIYVAVLIKNVAKISTSPFTLTPLAADSTGRTNVLLLGEGDAGHAGEGLSDTMMLLSINKPTNQTAQVSIPRDLRVPIPGYGYAKINSANAQGGVTLAQQTVSNTFGVPIYYFVSTNFSGLVSVIDSVGGIEVDVRERLYDPEYPCDNNQYLACGMDIQPGLQHMDGATALKYVRCRKGTCGNDYGRALRQQEVVNLLVAKIMTWQTLLNPSKLIPLTSSLSGALKTNMGAVQMGEFGLSWLSGRKHQPITLVLSTFPGNYLVDDPSSSDLLPKGGNFTTISNRIENIFTLPTLASDIPK